MRKRTRTGMFVELKYIVRGHFSSFQIHNQYEVPTLKALYNAFGFCSYIAFSNSLKIKSHINIEGNVFIFLKNKFLFLSIFLPHPPKEKPFTVDISIQRFAFHVLNIFTVGSLFFCQSQHKFREVSSWHAGY